MIYALFVGNYFVVIDEVGGLELIFKDWDFESGEL